MSSSSSFCRSNSLAGSSLAFFVVRAKVIGIIEIECRECLRVWQACTEFGRVVGNFRRRELGIISAIQDCANQPVSHSWVQVAVVVELSHRPRKNNLVSLSAVDLARREGA